MMQTMNLKIVHESIEWIYIAIFATEKKTFEFNIKLNKQNKMEIIVNN